MLHLNPHTLRPLFPALQQEVNGRPAVFLDGPGGTQVPQAVIEAMSHYLARDNSNSGGAFATSQRTDAVKWAARLAMADFLNAAPREVVFGANMTTLTFHLSRALARAWRPGDEIILTRLDHDANISPWLLAAAERGVTVRWLDFRPEDCTLRLDELPNLLSEKTRLVAITHASNAVGTMVDVKWVIELAHQAGALVYVDAVHYAPHASLDVKVLDCDFLATSTYKYFGPHAGVLYGKYDLLDSLTAYKVRPADDRPPGKWETGTASFEALAGIRAAVEYLAAIGAQTATDLSRREQLVAAYRLIQQHERELSDRFLRGAAAVPGLRVYGITDVERLDERTPTFAVSLAGQPPRQVAERLGEQGLFVWDGHYYAVAVMERLGLLESGGLVRVGFVHYNTAAEVDCVLAALAEI
ncbi:MAG: cysteine desulfurase-like protein [Chloroflexota bacterium]